jgi:hypothetical protein
VSSSKALKKLKKKTKRISNQSRLQLQSLKRAEHEQASKAVLSHRRPLQHDLKQLSGQVLKDVAIELAAPLHPLLSWFGEGRGISRLGIVVASRSDFRGVSAPASQLTPENHSSSLSLAAIPLKSPPCKKCPSLQGGLCRCAIKKFDIRV